MLLKDKVKYTSDNGYTGILSGRSTLTIYDNHGDVVLHTGHRKANTYDELVNIVEGFPEFMKMLEEGR